MIKVYLLSVSALRCEDLRERAGLKLDEERLAKVKQAKRTEDKMLRMGAGLLLQYAVKNKEKDTAGGSSVFAYGEQEIGCKQVSLEEVLGEIREPLELSFKYGPHGKPYLEQYPEWFFSLSHSGEYVVCAVADREVGADIQIVPVSDADRVKREKRILEKCYSEKERVWVETAAEEKEWRLRFYRIWAAKEAFIKWTGKGLAQGFDSFEVDMQEGYAFMETISAKICELPGPVNYTISLCVGE